MVDKEMETSSEFTRKILKKVRQIEIRTRKLVTEALSGAYYSAFKGQGMDFEEVREYAPGDDVRSIDWNVTARMDEPFIKKFKEERELTLMLLVDLSGSGQFGSAEESKRERAAELASVLAFSAVRNNDKVGLVLFTDEVETFILPKKGRFHVLRIIREILFFKPKGKRTHIPGVLDYFNNIIRRKSITFLISDFLQGVDGELPNIRPFASFHEQDPLIHSLEVTNKHHDLICVTLSDPREFEIPNVGILALEDAETGQIVEMDTVNPKVRKLYAKHNRARYEALSSALLQRGIDMMHVTTDEDYVKELRNFLRRRLSRKTVA